MNHRPKRMLISGTIMWIYSSLTLLVLLYMTYLSLRPKKDLLSATFSFPKHLGFSNYRKLIVDAGFFTYLFNSVVILVGALALLVLLSTMTAYGLGKFQFRFKSSLMLYFLIGLMFPVQLGIVPIFLIIRDMHLLNTQLSVILVLASGLSMPVFLLTIFFSKLPQDLYESARIDGANEWGTFVRVMFPLASPIIFTVCIIMSVSIWNQFFLPLILLHSDEKRTLPLMIMKFTQNIIYNIDMAIAGSVLATVPLLILFFFFSGRVIEGVAEGAVKG